ncbi:hypothetical protein, partial [Brevibacillus borstelensis]
VCRLFLGNFKPLILGILQPILTVKSFMRNLLINLELKLADLLIQEKMLRNCDTNHPINARNLEQIRSRIKSLKIQIDMIDVLRSVVREVSKKGVERHGTEQTELIR